MLDTKSLEDLVKLNVRDSVDHYVSSILADTNWSVEIENRIVKHVQDRITARFANISTVPDLVDTVKTSVGRLFDAGLIPGIGDYIDQTHLQQTIDHSIESMIEQTIDNLVIDANWMAKIENLINHKISTKISSQINIQDLDSLFQRHIAGGIDRWQNELLADFHTNGIQDQATELELVLAPGKVSVTNVLSAKSLDIADGGTVGQRLTVDQLSVTGSLDLADPVFSAVTDKIGQDVIARMTDQWRDSLIEDVSRRIRQQGIDIKNALVNGQPLLDNGTLHKSVTQSSLESVGTLEKLSVNGTTNLAHTLRVYRNRVGINTESPDMALSVWDEECNLGLGKLSQNQAFIGTGRLQSLAIGINRTPMIEIDDKGVTTIKQLKVARNRVAFESSLPGYSGTKGDIVINTDVKSDGVFAWICLGAFRWQPLKSAQ